MQSFSHGLNSRSSSAALSASQPSNIQDGISDDVIIAQGLLNNSKLTRASSFTSTSIGPQILDDGSVPIEGSGPSSSGRRRQKIRTSRTWTSSSGDVPHCDDIEDRTAFVNEYNRLAKKNGVRILIEEDFEESSAGHLNASVKSASWFSRKVLRRTSSTQSVRIDRNLKHRRSISDLSLRLKLKKDSLKDKDVLELVRLCGLSLLYLPTEYAPGSLAVPTCFRATAQYLVQHAPTSRGVFRIPGSHNVVASLYNHYCDIDASGQLIAWTVRCPTLPEHIRCDVHDVASAFKKFLSGLPGGILGSLSLFDALVSVQSQLHGDPELTRTKQSKVRARLIALAISTLRSHRRRELICAVFGLLCMIGRGAETTRREDDRGRPLPTSDLMGYGPLGIVFGPLLVGEMLENYTMRLANPRGGLVLLPVSPPKSRKEKQKEKHKKSSSNLTDDSMQFNSRVDKIKIANGITEMLITHWREVVKHMKNLSALQIVGGHRSLGATASRQPFLRPSASESFALRKPPDWDNGNAPYRSVDTSVSPTPAHRSSGLSEVQYDQLKSQQNDGLRVRKQRQQPRRMSSQALSRGISKSLLSPTVEEHALEDSPDENLKVESITAKPINRVGSSNKDVEQPLIDFAPSPSLKGTLIVDEMKASLAKAASPLSKQELTMEPHFEHGIESPRTRARPLATHTPVKEVFLQDAGRATPVEKTLPKFHRDSSDKENEPPMGVLVSLPPDPKGVSYAIAQPYISHSKPRPSGANDAQGLGNSRGCTHPKQQTHLREAQQVAPSISHQSPPEVMATEASSRTLERNASNNTRRTVASEPGNRPPLPVRSHRISKSTMDDCLRRDEMTRSSKLRNSKDPLTRVSYEEDLASLVTLAQALDALDTSVEIDLKLGTGSTNIHVPASHPNQVSKSERVTISERKGYETAESQKSVKSNNSITTNPSFPKTSQQRQGVSTSRRKYDPPRGSVKALAAKFNTADSPPLLPPSTNSPTKSLRLNTQPRFDSPKDSLVAPYTTNPSSPTRSQKSVISDKTPRSVRSLAPDRNPNKQATSTLLKVSDSGQESSPFMVSGSNKHTSPIQDSSPCKNSSPRRVLKSSLADSTPLRSVPKPLEGNPRSLSSTSVNCSNPYSISLKPVNKSDAAEMPTLATSLNLRPDVPKQVQISDSIEVPTNMLDGPSGSGSLGRVLSRPDQPPVAHHIHFARPQSTAAVVEVADILHSQSAFNNTAPIPASVNPVTSPVPGRSNSMLHGQLRTLQRQLISKGEEIRHLRQQLETRGNLDIGTLSEQLREAKREIQMWRTRAEVAEKQVEVMTKLSNRSNSCQTRNPVVVKASDQSCQSSTNYSEDGAVVSDRIRRALHGLDGATSKQESSEESSETVIRDIREAITGSEYSIWVEQTMNALEDAVPYELE